MTNKQIEASREMRLWIGQVIIPAVTGSVILLANPNVRNWAGAKINSIKKTFKKLKRD